MTEDKPIKAVIFGCSGTNLTDEEKEFFKEINPLGLILFDRNVKNPEQLSALTAEFKKNVNRQDAYILVDQEGGRAMRLWPPYWTALGWNRTYGDWYLENPEKGFEGVKRHAEVLAKDLLSVGINVDCWPCLDVATPTTHEIMKQRCFSDNPEIVAQLGQIGIEIALQKGLMPIIKHIPGYGRAQVDPHLGLPVVTESLEELKQSDFAPFAKNKLPVWGMTAHVIYTALDDQKPATLSKKTLTYVREKIGFEGFLICDDMGMGALKEYGTMPELAVQMLDAGCDAVLHCNGNFDQMREIAEKIPNLSEKAIQRLKKAEDLKNA